MLTSADNRFSGALAALDPGMVALVGVPVDANSSHRAGPSRAPAAIRSQLHCGSSNDCAENGVDLAAGRFIDLGDVIVDNEQGSMVDAERIEAAIGAVLATGSGIVSIGGDHSVTYPIVRAVAGRHSGVTIVHIDAHPDLYDDFAGNPLSHASPFARIMESGLGVRLLQLGVRTLNPHQIAQAERFGVQTVAARDFSRFDPLTVTGPVYVTIDLDGLDPAYAPGVSHHEPGGLTSRQVIDVIAALPGPIVGGDVVELNPDRDVHGMTAMLAAKLVKELASRMLG